MKILMRSWSIIMVLLVLLPSPSLAADNELLLPDYNLETILEFTSLMYDISTMNQAFIWDSFQEKYIYFKPKELSSRLADLSPPISFGLLNRQENYGVLVEVTDFYEQVLVQLSPLQPSDYTNQLSRQSSQPKPIANSLRETTLEKSPAISTPLVPLNKLGRGTYSGYEGGLYPQGENHPPLKHLEVGFVQASQVVPRNASGIPDPNGKIGLLSIGMSNTAMEFETFMKLAQDDPAINPHLVYINGARGGMTAARLQDPNDGNWGTKFWDYIINKVTLSGITPAQVQVAWIKEANLGPKLPFPTESKLLEEQLKVILQLLKGYFPNLRLAYLSSRIYAGYALTPLNPEPFAYESGFAVKWLIEKQINGDPQLAYDLNSGEAKVPWIAWGPYLWADGTNSNDGLVWIPEDLSEDDGTHPSLLGQLKVANCLLEFFKTDTITQTWFLVEGAKEKETTLQWPLVPDLPEDNLLKNPWFRVGKTPSLERWVSTSDGNGGWGASQKPGNPTPNEVTGTAARVSTGRGENKVGWSVDPLVTARLYQVVSADPTKTTLDFFMYWVTHTVDPATVIVYGSDSPEGPWEKVWVPFHQIYKKIIVPSSGKGNDLWEFYSSTTPKVSTSIEKGYPFYKLEISVSLPDKNGGFKITGIYFSAN